MSNKDNSSFEIVCKNGKVFLRDKMHKLYFSVITHCVNKPSVSPARVSEAVAGTASFFRSLYLALKTLTVVTMFKSFLKGMIKLAKGSARTCRCG